MKDKRAWKQALFWVSIRNTRKIVNKQTIEPVCLHKKRETNRFTEKVPAVGLEPTRGCPQQILSLPRLPFRHAGLGIFGKSFIKWSMQIMGMISTHSSTGIYNNIKLYCLQVNL